MKQEKNFDQKENIRNDIKEHYSSILKREPDESGVNFWYDKIISGEIKLNELKNHFDYLIIKKREQIEKINQNRIFKIELQEEYAKNKFKEIEGWLDPNTSLIISSLSQILNELKISGGIGEIGVHHGKLFILLHLMLNKNERSFCIDVFDKQELNLDHSGLGSYNEFIKNVQKFGNLDLVDIFIDSSLKISSNEIIDKTGQIKILSIDGGHTSEIVFNDFKLGEKILVEGGIIILDDYFNPMWPGVSEGTNRYFINNKTKLKPFAIAANKVFFSNNDEIKNKYYEYFKTRHKSSIMKFTKMLDSDVVVLR